MLRIADVQAHPSARTLESLVSGKLKRPDAGVVVQHLLSGCPRCAEITARLWDLRSNPEGSKSSGAASAGRAEAPLEEASAPPDMEGITAAEAVAQGELLKLAAELEDIRRKALTLSESLTPPNEECSTEIRAVIRCVVHDMIEPAIRSLQDGAEYRPPLHRPEPGASGMLIDKN